MELRINILLLKIWIKKQFSIDGKTLATATLNIVEENGFSYEVSAHNPCKTSYLGTHDIVHEREESISFDFCKNLHKAIQMTCALSVITESIKNGVYVIKRFMYYH